MKEINKGIFYYTASAIFFTLLSITLAIFTANKLYFNKEKITYVDKDFMISMKQNVNGKLVRMSDYDGLEKSSYPVNITNNANSRKYMILLDPMLEKEDEIRIAIDSSFIGDLNNFKKDSTSYILYEGYLEQGYSVFHTFGIWLKENSNLNDYQVNAKLKVKILDE